MTQILLPTALAVVGTDTGVGKTFAVRSILDHLVANGRSAVAIKPFVTGAVNGRWEDLDLLGVQVASGYGPARYQAPLSPYGAIRAGEPEINLERVRSYIARACASADITIIEGIGGVMVPLEANKLWIDLHAEYQWPALVIARSGLGTINHTLLTIEALRGRGVRIIGFILNATSKERKETAEQNARIIAELTQVESLGIVDYDEREPLRAWKAGAEWSRLEGMEGLLDPAD